MSEGSDNVVKFSKEELEKRRVPKGLLGDGTTKATRDKTEWGTDDGSFSLQKQYTRGSDAHGHSERFPQFRIAPDQKIVAQKIVAAHPGYETIGDYARDCIFKGNKYWSCHGLEDEETRRLLRQYEAMAERERRNTLLEVQRTNIEGFREGFRDKMLKGELKEAEQLVRDLVDILDTFVSPPYDVEAFELAKDLKKRLEMGVGRKFPNIQPKKHVVEDGDKE